MKLKRLVLVVALVPWFASCGGNDGGGNTGPGASGLEKSKTWSTLTMEERATLCDWGASMFGGYGMSMDCGNGSSIGSYPSQQACIDNFPPTCGATVAQFEACANASNCTTGILPPACAPLAACLQ
jgi:hypothetical protein